MGASEVFTEPSKGHSCLQGDFIAKRLRFWSPCDQKRLTISAQMLIWRGIIEKKFGKVSIL